MPSRCRQLAGAGCLTEYLAARVWHTASGGHATLAAAATLLCPCEAAHHRPLTLHRRCSSASSRASPSSSRRMRSRLSVMEPQ